MTLEFHDVTYTYDGATNALAHVSFSLEPGKALGVVGKTGSGKSTLAQLADGLLMPSSGEVRLDGATSAELRGGMQRRVGLVFQHPELQLFAATLTEDVAFGLHNVGVAQGEIEGRCSEALNLVGLRADEFASRSPFELSGGEQRKAALAGVLALHPEVLVLDEPTAGVDAAGVRDIEVLFKRLLARGTALIIISHSMELVADICSRAIVLDQGRCALAGTPEKVLAPDNVDVLQRLNVDIPQATRFAAKLQGKGFVFEEPVLTMDNLADQLARQLSRPASGTRLSDEEPQA